MPTRRPGVLLAALDGRPVEPRSPSNGDGADLLGGHGRTTRDGQGWSGRHLGGGDASRDWNAGAVIQSSAMGYRLSIDGVRGGGPLRQVSNRAQRPTQRAMTAGEESMKNEQDGRDDHTQLPNQRLRRQAASR